MKRTRNEKRHDGRKTKTRNKNNEVVQNLIQQNTDMKEQIAESEDRHLRNNSRFMGIKKKSGVESETWEESETKVKDFLQEKLGSGTEKITIERKEGKRRTIIPKFLNYKQPEKVLNKYKERKLWEDQIYINEDFSEYTVEKRRILFKKAKEIRERGEFAKIVYNRLVSF